MKQTHYPRAPRPKIAVTQELIDFAVPRDSSHCMISEAIRVAFPQASHVSTDLQTIRFTDPAKGLRYTYLTPRTAQVALVQWDQGVKPEPWSFQLRGGQVTQAGGHRSRLGAKNPGKPPASRAKLAKQTLVSRGKGKTGTVPEVVGGRTPPTTGFARRRAFGLRGLEL